MRACRKVGCRGKTDKRGGYCDVHAQLATGWRNNEKRKGDRHARGYGTGWSKTRLVALERDKRLCQNHLLNGQAVPGNHVDHIIPKCDGGTDDLSNLQTLCKECHERKTARERKDGRKS